MALFFQKAEHDLAGNVADLQQQLQRVRRELAAERKAHTNTKDELETAVSERDNARKQIKRKAIPNPHADGERHWKTGCVTCLMAGHNPKADYYAVWEPK